MLRAALAALVLPFTVLAEEGKPYRLFIGVDLRVKDSEDALREVKRLDARHVVLDEPGQPRLPLRDLGPFNWKYLTKVSGAPVSITEVEQHLAFSLKNDKALEYMATQSHLGNFYQERNDVAAMGSYNAAARNGVDIQIAASVESARAAGIAVVTIPASLGGAAALDAAATGMNQQSFESAARMGDPDLLERAQDASGQGGEDVLELTFRISSPVPVADAYVMVTGTVTQGEEEGAFTFHHPLGAIGPEPRNIKIRKLGFPPGFAFRDPKFHVFARGTELATNLSERAVGLTREQVRQFLLLSHLADHPLDELPPEPVWSLPPPSLLAAENPKRFDRRLAVNVDAEGQVTSIHESVTAAQAFLQQRDRGDATGSNLDPDGRLPPDLVATVRELLFVPAMDLGVPVAGTVELNLADFLR